MSQSGEGSLSAESLDNDPQYSCLGRFMNRCRKIFRKGGNSQLAVHAVDSVRLVYIRRIQEHSANSIAESSHTVRSTEPIVYQTTAVQHDSSDTRDSSRAIPEVSVLHRGRRVNEPTIDAIEKALKSYESKHKSIIQKTAPISDKFGALGVRDSQLSGGRKNVAKIMKRKPEEFEYELSKTENAAAVEKNLLVHKGGDDAVKKKEDDDEEEEKNISFDVESMSLESIPEEADEKIPS